MREKTSTTTMPNPKKKMTRYPSASFPSCFRSTSAAPALDYPHAPPPTTTTAPNLTTSLYQTHLGLFSLTWSRSLLSRSLHLSLSSLSLSFHLTLKPFIFWNKHGFKKLTFTQSDAVSSIWVFWDLTNAKFGSDPEPLSGFYIAVLSEGEMTLLVGDLEKQAYSKTKAKQPRKKPHQSLVVRREHVFGNKFYTTRSNLGGKNRLISIELNNNSKDDPRLVIKFDSKRVLQVKHLKWKFRGSDRIEVDGHPIQLSWDVYNWLFDDDFNNNNQEDGYALFTFRFEKQGSEVIFNGEDEERESGKREKVLMWTQDSCGLNYERKQMKKRILMKTRSSSSSSLSSASSGCSSSVLEWETVEENELKGPTGFSLLVYAWKS